MKEISRFVKKVIHDVLTAIGTSAYTYVVAGMIIFVLVVTLTANGFIGKELGALLVLYCTVLIMFGTSMVLMNKETYHKEETLVNFATLFLFLAAIVWTIVYLARLVAFVFFERM